MGNLTLTGYNAEYSDRPFEQKRDMPGGFKHSPLRLNTGLGEIDTWNEAAIQARAERLAEMAMAVWSAPQLPAEILATCITPSVRSEGYTIEDHHYLTQGSITRQLFEAFRQAVLALDPCVTKIALCHRPGAAGFRKADGKWRNWRLSRFRTDQYVMDDI